MATKSIELRGATRKLVNLISLTLVSVLVLELIPIEASAFPSLFNVRAHSIFRRQQQQQQQQQSQQPQSQQAASVDRAPQENLIALGNEPSFNPSQFGASRSALPVELMRISAGAQPTPVVNSIGAHQLHQALLSSAASQPHQQRHQFAFADDQFSGPIQTGFYMPQAAIRQHAISPVASELRQHSRPQAEQSASFELSDSTSDYFSNQNEEKSSANEQPAANQLHREPSHTSEIVDKIEQHIGQQVEHSLQQHAAASGYQQHAEKEAAPREEAAEGEQAGAMEEEKIEKRHEAESTSPKESHESEHHHMEHHQPPEAFEVHHKKGGKSFQYFHMGHHH